MIIKNAENVELNTKIVNAILKIPSLNIQTLKVIYVDVCVVTGTSKSLMKT